MKWLIGLIVVSIVGPAHAGSNEEDLARAMRVLLLEHLPKPLYQKRDWDKKKEVKALRIRDGRPKVERVWKNDGVWRAMSAELTGSRDDLKLEVRDLATHDDGRLTFTVMIAADIRYDLDQQHWENGLKLYGASLRARARTKATLQVEAIVRLDFSAGLPEVVGKLRVAKANVAYDDLVVEHMAGLGGDAAKVIGKSARDLLRQWHPSIERDLLAKADRAIEKALANKEVRVGLGKMLKAKK